MLNWLAGLVFLWFSVGSGLDFLARNSVGTSQLWQVKCCLKGLYGWMIDVQCSSEHGTVQDGRTRGPVFRPCSFVRWPLWWVRLLWLGSLFRIGEASVPGPGGGQVDHGFSFKIGVCNPNGLQDKASFFGDSIVDLWCVSETHLTSAGFKTFRQQLRRFAPSYGYSCFGHAVLPRTEVSDIGRWSGVGVVSSWPTHRLAHDWPESLYVTGRLCVTTSLVANQWITGCVVYGTPCGPTHPAARQTTEKLLDAAILRVLQTSGPRFVGGDFNHDHSSLQAIQKLRQLGFVDVQDLHFARHGVPPVATCRNRTRRDFLFVSAELAVQFQACQVTNLDWTDHASVIADFRFLVQHLERFPWPKPDPIPWKELTNLDPGTVVSFDSPCDCQTKYRELWSQVEQGAVVSAATKGRTIPSRCLGRASRVAPEKTTFQVTPLRAGRAGDIRPSFMGFSHLHRQWFRQLRRLESYCRLVRSGVLNDEGRLHRGQLWTSIVEAVGFRPSFSDWWSAHPSVSVDLPVLPLCSPDFHVASRVFRLFKGVVMDFEKHLKQQQRYVASVKKKCSLGALFKAVKRDPPDPVTVLVRSRVGQISGIDRDTCAVEFCTPVAWDDSVPFVHLGKEIDMVYATPDKLWVEEVERFEVGDHVVQTEFTGRLEALFDAFHQQWATRWQKHQRVEPSQWQQILDFASQVLKPVSCHSPPLDFSMWRALVQSKPPRSATGLDGVSLGDLKALGVNHGLSILSLYARAEKDGQWPPQILSGSVQSLAKVPTPSSVGDYRPVTVLGLTYRLWSSFHSRRWLKAVSPVLDDHLCGNRPGFRPSDVWRTVLRSVEDAVEADGPACGFVADLVKAYNTLPRYPVMFACKLLGVDHGVLTAWAGALSQVKRHFNVRASYSDGLLSTTGLPEGCGLSCLGMLALDALLHKWMKALSPEIRTLTFVDNWEVVVRDPALLDLAFQRLCSFVDLLDLELDLCKTYFWSTSSEHRQSLKLDGKVVKLNAKDLGAHVAYSRQVSNRFLHQRVVDLSPFWTLFESAPGGHHIKLRVLLAAAWPRALHACSAVVIGRRIFETLRGQCMKAFGLQKPGASTWLQFGLDGEGVDPLQWVITCTLKDFCSDEVQCEQGLNKVVEERPYSPSHLSEILLQRIHQLGWKMDSVGCVQDTLGTFCLRSIHIQHLLFRIQWAWTLVIHRHVCHRPSLCAFDLVDREMTRRDVLFLDDYSQGILRRHLNGSVIANDVTWRWSDSGASSCRMCGQPDSVYHRLWTCEASADLRAQLEDSVIRYFDVFPQVLSVHGWTLCSPYWTEWLGYLMSLSVGIPPPNQALPEGQIVDLFTDGSCFWPCESRYRLAAWSVVLAAPLDFAPCSSQCSVLAAAPLGGVCQSASRAELQAFLVALNFGFRAGAFTRIWSDCQSVLNRFRLLTSGVATLRRHHANRDLWSQILELVEAMGLERVQTVKVPAHEDQEATTNAFDSWVTLSNSCADTAAKGANLQRAPTVWALWERHMLAVEKNRSIGCSIRDHMIKVANRWTQDWKTKGGEAEGPRRSVRVPTPLWPQSTALQLQKDTFRKQFGQAFTGRMLDWFNSLWSASVPTRWISYAQLYTLYQLHFGDAGVWKQKRKWHIFAECPGSTGEQFRFGQLCKYFRLMVQQLLKDCEVAYCSFSTRPDSQMIQCHVGCLGLPLLPKLHLEVEQWLERKLLRPLRGSSTKLALPLAV